MINKQLITLPNNTINQLGKVVGLLISILESYPEITLEHISACLHKIAEKNNNSIIILVANKSDLIEELKQIEKENYTSNSVFAQNPNFKERAAFLCTGGGAQYPEMGKKLYENEPVFKEAVDECAQLALTYLPHDIRDVLFSNTDIEIAQLINRIDYMQMTLFAYQYGMYKLWNSYGIQPNVMIGHSIGEIIASCLAGVFSLKDGIKFTCMSGALVQNLTKKANMVVVQAERSIVDNYVLPFKKTIAVAVINSPSQTVISGDTKDIKRLITTLEKDGIETKMLKISHAFHSPLMQPALEEYIELIESLEIHEPKIPLVSCISGGQIGKEVTTLKHWKQHLLGAVNFLDAYKAMYKMGIDTHIELGPAPVLVGIIDQFENDRLITNLAPSTEDKQKDFYENLAQWIVEGGAINEEKVFASYEETQELLAFEHKMQELFYSIKDNDHAINDTQNNQSLSSEKVLQILKEKVGEVLNHNPKTIRLETPLKELGMNSLKIIKLAEQLSVAFSRKIKVSQIFKYPTINDLSSFLLSTPVKKEVGKKDADINFIQYEEKIETMSIQELEDELAREISLLDI